MSTLTKRMMAAQVGAARHAAVPRVAVAFGAVRFAHHAPQGTSFEPDMIGARLDLNPTAAKQLGVAVKPTAVTKQARKYWKREGKTRSSAGLYNNFADIKHTTLSEQAAVKEASRCLKVVIYSRSERRSRP